jgi:hypothetical protein
MAGAGKKTFTAGEVLTASDVNTYLMEQSVMVFGGTAARSSAIPTPSEGMTTYRTDTQQIESYDGAQWRGMSGLQLVKTQTIGTGVSSVEVTGAFSATYENYKIIVSGGASAALGILALRMGTTNTGYYNSRIRITYASATVSGQAVQNTTDFNFAGYGATDALYMDANVSMPFASKKTTFQSNMIEPDTGGGIQFTGGFLNNTTSYTSFQILTSSTLTGGTIYVYGYGT